MDHVQQTPLAFVIEDEIHLAAIFAKALEMSGFSTTIYNNGRQALDSLGVVSESPRLVVLDLNLPQISGKEILRFIRSNAQFSKTWVILATSDSAAVAGEVEDKSDLVLLKPISFSQLRELASRFR